jgi:hypothetical protein
MLDAGRRAEQRNAKQSKTESKRNDKYGRKEYLVGEKVSSRLRNVILENVERVLAGSQWSRSKKKRENPSPGGRQTQRQALPNGKQTMARKEVF